MNVKKIPALISVCITLIIWHILPIPEGVTPQAWHLLALFLGTIVAIIGKAMPIGVVSIIAITLVALTGVTSDKPAVALNDALSSFSNSLIWLIVIAIFISVGLSKTGLGGRLGYYFVSLWGKKTIGIAYSLAISELVLAPVTPSNTARGGGIMHPIMRAIANSFDSKSEDGTEGKIGKYLALVNYHSNPITSAMFITATAPNPLVADLIANVTNQEIYLTWSTWALAMLLPGLVAILVMPLIIFYLHPPEIKKTPNASSFAKEKLKEMDPMSKGEKIMLGVFGLMLFLWAGVPAMLLGSAWTVNATTTAFIGLSVLLLTGVLTWQDILKEKSAWDTMIWFSALIMMATYLNKLGIITWLSGLLQLGIGNMGVGGVGASILLLLAYTYAHYMFASTTAHVTAMFAAFYTAGIVLGADPMLYGLMLASCSSLMMTLTHYATGTSPIIFGSGYVTLSEWWKTGFIMSVANILIFLFVGGVWWKVLGYW